MKLPWRPMSPNADGSGPKIDTSLTANEANELRKLAAGQVVVEVGSALGFSTIVMAQVARLVVSVDHHLHLQDGLKRFVGNLQRFKVDNVVVIVGGSEMVLPLLRAGEYDAAFVDGDHSQGGVRNDAKEAERLVRIGGVIAFHDHGEDTCPEVAPTLDEIYGGAGALVDTLYVVRR